MKMGRSRPHLGRKAKAAATEHKVEAADDPPVAKSNWLHLFTGTSRQLFVQDVLNLLASPMGQYYRFRYSTDLLPDSVCEPWAANAYTGHDVAVHHVIVQEYGYHLAAY